MQSGGKTKQVGGGGASASPSSSSSAASALEQQQQRQSIQQQFLRRPEGNDAHLSYQAGNYLGVLGGVNFAGASSTTMPQQQRNLIDLAQQHGSPNNISEQNYNRIQGAEQQQMLNPTHQAYLQFAFQAQQKSNMGMQTQQQMKPGMFGSHGKDQDTRVPNMKMQELMSIQSAVNQSQNPSSSKKPSEHSEKPTDQSQKSVTEQHRIDPKSNYPAGLLGQTMTPSAPFDQSQQAMMNMASNQMAMAAQVQAFALERNIDLSNPANANIIAQIIPFIQSRMATQQKQNESIMQPVSFAKQVITQSNVGNENSPRGSDVSGQSGLSKSRQPVSVGAPSYTAPANTSNVHLQQFNNQMPPRQQTSLFANGMQSSNQGTDNLLIAKSSTSGSEVFQSGAQNARQNNQPLQSAASPTNDRNVGNSSSQQMRQPHVGFTKKQLHVLKAQILAFRRIKKGEGTLPSQLLQAISPPPLDLQTQQACPPPPITVNREKAAGENVEESAKYMEPSEETQVVKPVAEVNTAKEGHLGEEGPGPLNVNTQNVPSSSKELRSMVSPGKEELPMKLSSMKSEQTEPSPHSTPTRSNVADRGKTVLTVPSVSEAMQIKKPSQPSNTNQPKDSGATRKYHGPLFDFPVFTRKHDNSSSWMNKGNNLTLGYEIKDLFDEDGGEIQKRKRAEKIEKIDKILAVNIDRKRIRPDLIIRLQIESKKLQLAEFQVRLRDEIEQQQLEIMNMPDRPYRKFVRLCERQRQELNRQAQASQRAIREKQLKSIFQWRKKLLEAHWAIRDSRIARNRGVHKYHERMLREFSKNKDDDRSKRMEALKNNDVERYREMLLEQQTNVPGEAAERYAVLSSFLTQTEEYLQKLGGKITAAKNLQEVEEAANVAAAAARAQGLSEEEVRSAAACAREEVMIRNRFSEMNAPKDKSSVNKYYTLAHAVNERVIRQPSMLRAGTLRDYQLVGLQWMLSLYNNKLNGILADEMGLGKTVQVMALIAYLMEFKGNYGPHLIIVPNAVLVNWKSELHNWLPTVSCIYYVGGKEQRAKLFSQEVLALKFNVLVTTYEFIMFDRSKLSKIDWKYIIIDEAQRMKDRDSVLARDLDRYRCQRRLLLTGTPLQNDLKELWSLLNLLLPDVFDNKKAFNDWFSQPFQKEGAHNGEDDWLETEKKVIIIHRLHQILEPFMLRRRVEDVEGSLPPKVSIVLKCRMSAIQGAIYDWIKSTNTIRVDPEDERRKVQKNPMYQAKTYKPLNNRCMELRKACNHPLLNYPYYSDISKDFLVRSCGKLWILDRVLVKLQRTGHRVLLFSTMTKLLDIMEEYLQWRRLVFRRIDGTTSLEDRESAIVDFNSPDTDCFIFLLSIRAAGRGLNLQSADTVIIYDPDPNPKNEEQAVARAHRIGQTREVKVIYMEAVVDKISSHQKEDEFKTGGTIDDSDDDLAGKDRYMGSIESLIRNNIQQYKIDMADEVINAGRFDQRTTHEERRMTLETLLHDEERYQETLHDVPSLHEVNRMIARSEEEVDLFDQMDEEFDWAEDMTRYDEVPKWIRAGTKEVNAAIARLSKKPAKNGLYGSGVDPNEVPLERKRGRPRTKVPIYTEFDDENEGFSEASSEAGEIGDFEDEEYTEAPQVDKNESEEDTPGTGGGYEYQRASVIIRNNNVIEEAASSGSSSHDRRLLQKVSPSVSSQKFGSLSALDGRSSSRSKKLADDLEDGEIALSGDSPMEHQQSGSWNQDREEGEGEQVLQPKIKRKRSIRLRPRNSADKSEEKYSDKPSLRRHDPSQLPFQVDNKYKSQVKDEHAQRVLGGEPSSLKPDKNNSSMKNKRSLPTKTAKPDASLKSGRLNFISNPDDTAGRTRESLESKVSKGSASSGNKMSEVIQRKCKNVISKLQRRIDKEGHQIIPQLTELWKRIESSSGVGGDNLVDLRKIDVRVDKFDYSGVMELVSDVQLMLKHAIQYYGYSPAVKSEARKVHDLFFDILKIAFPDTDFREARNAMSFSSPTTTGPSSRQMALAGQSKRQKLVKEMDPNNGPLQKPLARIPIQTTVEDTKVRNYFPQKETRLASGSTQMDDKRPFTHPLDLVICKKKRKDRSGPGSAGPLSPTGPGRSIKSPGSGSGGPGPQSSSQQGWGALSPQGNSGSGGGSVSVGWANPVKRMRTDAGRRRASHL